MWDKQKGLSLIFRNLTLLKVTPAGLEPTTNRAEICHSIQLNYGAKSGCKNIKFSEFIQNICFLFEKLKHPLKFYYFCSLKFISIRKLQ